MSVGVAFFYFIYFPLFVVRLCEVTLLVRSEFYKFYINDMLTRTNCIQKLFTNF